MNGFGAYEGYYDATRYLGFAGIAVGLVLFLVVIYLAFGSWSRRAADEATNLRPVWQFILALLTLSPAVICALIVLRQPAFAENASGKMIAALVSGLAGFAFLVLVLPLLAAIPSRAAGARLRTAWRGNLRRLLPVMIALCAIVFLGANAYAARMRSQWAEKWSAPGVSEMSELIRSLGDKWTNPAIPPDAWRAEYAPTTP
jgi:Na+/H+ antiporter NhaC